MPFQNPFPAVDIIIEIGPGIVLIERANPPFGWAIPGGFVDYGESLEIAASRSILGNRVKSRVIASVPYLF